MKKFYILISKVATLSPNLSYSHYVELLPFEDINKVRYYINQVEEYNLSIRQLRERIKSNEYEILDKETKLKLINTEDHNVIDLVKNPILIKNSYNYDNILSLTAKMS